MKSGPHKMSGCPPTGRSVLWSTVKCYTYRVHLICRVHVNKVKQHMCACEWETCSKTLEDPVDSKKVFYGVFCKIILPSFKFLAVCHATVTKVYGFYWVLCGRLMPRSAWLWSGMKCCFIFKMFTVKSAKFGISMLSCSPLPSKPWKIQSELQWAGL